MLCAPEKCKYVMSTNWRFGTAARGKRTVTRSGFSINNVAYTTYRTRISHTIDGLSNIRDITIGLLTNSVVISCSPTRISPSSVYATISHTNCSTSPIDVHASTTPGNDTRTESNTARVRSPAGGLRTATSTVHAHLVVSVVFLVPLFCVNVKRVLN